MHSIDKGIGQNSSTRCLLRDYLGEGGARVWVAERRALLDVGLRCTVALLNLSTEYNNKLWMLRSRGPVLLTGKQFKPRCGLSGFNIVTTDRCPEFFKIATTEEKASLFVFPGSSQYVLLQCSRKAQIGKESSNGGDNNFAILNIYWACPSTARGGPRWDGAPCLRHHPYFIPSFISF